MFAAAFFIILPLAMPVVFKSLFSLVLGLFSADIFLFRQKREHMRRHTAEAELLGFACQIKENLWNPFAVPVLLLAKDKREPEEDRLLADLVRMRGPAYGMFKPSLSIGVNTVVICMLGVMTVIWAAPAVLPVFVPLFGLAVLFFLFSRAEGLFEKYENRHIDMEMSAFLSPDADYKQWNFLSLEAKRVRSGRIAAMEKEIGSILFNEAGLAEGAKILETGAGGGFLWKHLPKELKPAWTQAEKNEHAALYAKRHSNGHAFCNSDIRNMPFGDNSFDAIVGLECFDSLTGQTMLEFMPEAKRLLKPGGRLVHLKDFPDWPGQAIAARFNLFSLRALRGELVRIDKDLRFEFEEICAQDIAALASAVSDEDSASRPYAQALAEMYRAGIRSDRRFTIPMLVSVMVLKKIFVTAGFEIMNDCLERSAKPGVVAYIVARKPF